MDCDPRPLVVHVLHSLGPGGTQRALLALLRGFDPARMRHAVVTLREAGELAAELPSHVACWALEARGRSRAAGLALRRIARLWRPRIIHARNTGSWLDAIVGGCFRRQTQVVLGFHGVDSAGPLRLRHRAVARLGGRCGAVFTSVSHRGSERLFEEAGVPTARTTLLENGVDRSLFRPATSEQRAVMRARLNLPASALVVGGVGSLTVVKRWDLLLSAARGLLSRGVDVRVLLAGEGPLREGLLNQAVRLDLGGRLHLLGRRKDVGDVLAAMDVYVCASDSEEISNALLEAMAAGLPVVSTDVGDHRRILSAEAGLIVPTNDTEALAAALLNLAGSPHRRRALGEAARRRTMDFDLATTVRAYEAFYESLVLRAHRAAQPACGSAGASPSRVLSRPSLAVPHA